EVFSKFLQSPDRESYLAVHAVLIASEHYDPYSRELNKIEELIDAGELDTAREQLAAAMRNLLLSPKAHWTAGLIAKQSNDQDGARMAGLVGVRCCQGIVATGDGSKRRPYIVTRVSDEYDVLQYLEKQPVGQALTGIGNRHFDVIRCA